MELLVFIIFITICYYTGSTIEKNHYKKLKARELALYKYPCFNYEKALTKNSKIKNTCLVSGSVVIGCDYFKVLIAGLINIFGGNISAYESVLDRGRREAILRMREQAFAKRANVIINTKIETITLDNNGNEQNPKICVLAYGTAIEYEK